MVQYEAVDAKTPMNRLKYIDSWFWTRYTINSYKGCQIGCIYCNSRNDRYNLPILFEQDIKVKQNLPELLDKKLRSTRSWLPDVVGLSGATDPYQAAERTYRITRNLLQVLRKYYYPVHIITKSRLVKEDLELIESIANDTWATISFSITCMDPHTSKLLEPGAPSPRQRLDLISYIKENFPSIQVGVSASPIIPYIADDDMSLRELIQEIKSSGADYALPSVGLTMHNQQAQWFLNKLEQYDAALIDQYERLYKFTYLTLQGGYNGSTHPNTDYWVQKQHTVMQACETHGLPTRIKRFIPTDFRKYNYRIAEAIINKLPRFESKDPLFWAAMNLQNLDRSVVEFPSIVHDITINTPAIIELQLQLKQYQKRPKRRTLESYFS